MVTYAAEETRDPERTIPRALMLGTAVVVVIYLALNSGLSAGAAVRRGADVDAHRLRRDAGDGRAGRGVGDLDPRHRVVASARSAASSSPARASTTRWREDGLLFEWMGARAPDAIRRRTSRSSLQAIWSSVLVLTGTYGALVSRVVYTEWIFFGALALGTIALRRSRGYAPAFRACGLSRRAGRCSRSSASPSSSIRSSSIRARA